MARPKNEIPRTERLTLRLSKFELEKISRLERDKPKKFKNLNKKHSNNLGAVDDDIKEFL